MPKISVIMTVYNLEYYVKRAVESVMVQTFPDFELIVINDGSDDGSAALLNELARQDSRMQVIHTENRGVARARNTGIEQASGEWLAFLDGDDFYYPHALETMYAKTDGCDIVVANFEQVFAEHMGPPFYHLPTEEEANRADRLEGFFAARLEIGDSAMNKLYRRAFVMESGVRFEPREEIFAEDSFFNAQLLRDAGRIRVADRVVAGYYQRQGSETYSRKTELAERCIRFLDRLSLWYGHSCDDALKLRAVRLYCGVLQHEAMRDYRAFHRAARDIRLRQWVRGADYTKLPENRRNLRFLLRLLPIPVIPYCILRLRHRWVHTGKLG